MRRAVFFDVGGVLGTNGWDRRSRADACQRFGLEEAEFEDRHEFLAAAFDRGEISLSEYLDRTVFYRERPFSREEFQQFMFDQSRPDPAALELLGELVEAQSCVLATLNNESRELNRHRIEVFGLRRYFSLFLTSCYLGVRKPEPAIYRAALDLTQRAPEECLFVDDRAINIDSARMVGIRAVQFRGIDQLRQVLQAEGLLREES